MSVQPISAVKLTRLIAQHLALSVKDVYAGLRREWPFTDALLIAFPNCTFYLVFGHPTYLNCVCKVALAFCPLCCSLKYTNLLFKELWLSFICQILSMPPRRKSRRLAEPNVSNATEVQFGLF